MPSLRGLHVTITTFKINSPQDLETPPPRIQANLTRFHAITKSRDKLFFVSANFCYPQLETTRLSRSIRFSFSRVSRLLRLLILCGESTLRRLHVVYTLYLYLCILHSQYRGQLGRGYITSGQNPSMSQCNNEEVNNYHIENYLVSKVGSHGINTSFSLCRAAQHSCDFIYARRSSASAASVLSTCSPTAGLVRLRSASLESSWPSDGLLVIRSET